ncbi:MAG: glycosyltransferase family 2 protein [Candidatus Saccharibacteria bacterium]
MKKVVAFIIVGWHNEKLLPECINSVLAQTYSNIKIYYVDNGSADNSVKLVKENYPDVICIETGKNNGFAKGNNIGIREALKDKNVEYIALLNTDATIEKLWAQKLVTFADGKKRVAAMQGITLDYYNHNIIDSTHIFLSRSGQATQGSYRDDLINIPSSFTTMGVNAAAAMYTREFIDAQPFESLFDETMFMYLEDVDVALRSIVMGYKNYCVKDTYAYHMGSASSKSNKTYPAYMTFRNNSGLLVKNLPIGTLAKLLFRVISSDRARVKHLRQLGRKEEAKAVVKGRLFGLLLLPIFYIKRLRLNKSRNIDKNYLWHLMKKGY